MLREAQHWQASFPYEEVEAACETLGVDVTLTDGAKLTIEERGDSGRAVSLGLNGLLDGGPSHRARVHEDALNPHHQPARAGDQAWMAVARAMAMAWA